MKGKRQWMRLLTPLIAMLALLFFILLEQRGLPLEEREPVLNYLADSDLIETQAQKGPAAFCVAWNPENEAGARAAKTVTDVLNEMRVDWRSLDWGAQALDLAKTQTLLICSGDLSPLEGEMLALNDWIEAGGRLGLMVMPEAGAAFSVLSGKLGVTESAGGYVEYRALRFVSDALPMWVGRLYDSGALSDYALAVRLDADCQVHVETGEGLPLLWSRELGGGRVAVMDNNLIGGKDSRGYVLSALFALEDELVYPIVNAGMVFIDDFPAPQPEGFNERLLAQNGYDIQGFFRNHWWPDMKRLSWDAGLRYTGVLIETYNDRVEPPFEPDGDDPSLVRYYASELLHSGGELGLHGYNHMPLCPRGFVYGGGEEYAAWPSAANMSAAIEELYRYGRKILPQVNFATYVPPSNYLSAAGQKTLLQTVPQVRTISGLYLPEAGVDALYQEFCEEADGSISVPRITVGFSPDEYNRLVLAQELLLHGVFSHFIHPDDVLDAERGAEKGWQRLYADFSALIGEIQQAYPPLRMSTASEGAAAVQRYDRLRLARTEEARALRVDLEPFYDNAWLALYTRRPVAGVEGGALFPIGENMYWIRADGPAVRVLWEEDA